MIPVTALVARDGSLETMIMGGRTQLYTLRALPWATLY